MEPRRRGRSDSQIMCDSGGRGVGLKATPGSCHGRDCITAEGFSAVPTAMPSRLGPERGLVFGGLGTCSSLPKTEPVALGFLPTLVLLVVPCCAYSLLNRCCQGDFPHCAYIPIVIHPGHGPILDEICCRPAQASTSSTMS